MHWSYIFLALTHLYYGLKIATPYVYGDLAVFGNVPAMSENPSVKFKIINW